MKEVAKNEFYSSFKNLNVTTGCPVSHKVWEVRLRATHELIAKSVEESGEERFFIKL